MIRTEYKETAMIQGKNPNQVTNDLNEILFRMKECNPTFTKRFYESVGHVIDVEWTVEVLLPETARDEFYLENGFHHHCGECPHYRVNDDRRMKYSHCDLGRKVWCEKDACEEFYIGLKEGQK